MYTRMRAQKHEEGCSRSLLGYCQYPTINIGDIGINQTHFRAHNSIDHWHGFSLRTNVLVRYQNECSTFFGICVNQPDTEQSTDQPFPPLRHAWIRVNSFVSLCEPIQLRNPFETLNNYIEIDSAIEYPVW